MNLAADLNAPSPEQLRALAGQLIAQAQERDREIEEKTREVEENGRELHYRQTRIEQLSHEISILKRQQFGRHSEQLSSEQMSQQDEAVDADLAAIELELKQLQPQATADQSPQQPKRASQPAQLPRTEIHHEPDITVCQRGCERVRMVRTSVRSWTTRRACSR
jgi:chromosome segregation ATPase